MAALPDGAMTATVLFTDLVGSTAMRSALGDVRADELRSEHDRLIETLVEAENGTVVKGLGDGIMAAFPAPSQALSCAAAVQKRLRELNRNARSNEAIHVRMGASVGEVVVEGGDIFGTPVVEASRLCSAADGGEILVADIVVRLAGSRSTLATADRGALELKGLPDPLPTREVLWEQASDHDRVPLPDPPGLQKTFDFAGRRLEVLSIGASWRLAMSDRERVIVITGESGRGKTRLLSRFGAKAHAEGAVILYGRCEELVGYAYQPFAEAFRQYLQDRPDREVAERIGPHAAALHTLVPEKHLATRLGLPEPEPLPPELARRRFHQAVAGWLAAASHDSPVVLMLDGLQWATPPTIDLLRDVIEMPSRRLVVMLSYRASEVGQDHPLNRLLGELRRDKRIERIDLGVFTDEDLADLVDRAAGAPLGELSGWLGASLRHRGVVEPWPACETVMSLIEQGVIHKVEPDVDSPQVDPYWSVGVTSAEQLPVMATQAEVASALLGRLTAGARDTLRCAAVLGGEFDTRVLRELPDQSDETVAAALTEAEQLRLLAATDKRFPRWAFVNGALRAQLYDEVAPQRRALLHARAVDVIDTGSGRRTRRELAELARHAAIAASAGSTSVSAERAVGLAEAAGERAVEQFADSDAAVWFRRSLDIGGRLGALNEPRRVELLLELGRSERRAGMVAARSTLVEAGTLASRIGSVGQLADAALAACRDPFSQEWSLDAEVLGLLHLAVDESVGALPERRARLLADLAAESVWDPAGGPRSAWADEALSLARSSGDANLLADVLVRRTVVVHTPETMGERVELAAELRGLADKLDEVRVGVHAATQLARACRELGDIERSALALEHAEAVVADVALPELAWSVAIERSVAELHSGQMRAAETAAREALELGGRAGHPEVAGWFAYMLLAIRRPQGRAAEALAGVRSVPPAGVAGVGDPALAMLAWLDAGHRDEAWRWYSEAAAGGFVLGRTPRTGAELMGLAELAYRFADTAGAEALFDRLVAHADVSFAAVGHWPVAAHSLGLLSGLLGNLDEAHAWMARALDREERGGAVLAAIETKVAWAELHRAEEGPSRSRGRELAREALEAASRLDATGLVEKAHGILTELG